MKVLYVASEAYPLVKVGGLGDVAGAFPAALRRCGVDARLMLPAYPQAVRAAAGISAGPSLGRLLGGEDTRILAAAMPDADTPLWLADCPALFARKGGPYHDGAGEPWPDNHLRFGLLSRAAAVLASEGLAGWRPDIVHVNDWHTGLVPAYLKNRGGTRPRTVFTVHNMAYQGLFPGETLGQLALPPHSFTPDGLEYWGQVSFLKAGLVYADSITTVSPTYAREILGHPLGEGMEGVVASRKETLTGILNGIDVSVWDPARDTQIEKRYTAGTLPDKAHNKLALQAELGLQAGAERPLAGVISRFVHQKGIDILIAAMPALTKAGCQVAILGEGDKALEKQIQSAAASNPGAVAARIAFDESLAHRMIAGSDMLVMPSRFEPCGITQLFAQRYGTLPVARAVGGLADTVRDGSDGFAFEDATPAALTAAVARALRVFSAPASWQRMQRRAMSKDLSWNNCAKRYIGLYQALLDEKPG